MRLAARRHLASMSFPGMSTSAKLTVHACRSRRLVRSGCSVQKNTRAPFYTHGSHAHKLCRHMAAYEYLPPHGGMWCVAATWRQQWRRTCSVLKGRVSLSTGSRGAWPPGPSTMSGRFAAAAAAATAGPMGVAVATADGCGYSGSTCVCVRGCDAPEDPH